MEVDLRGTSLATMKAYLERLGGVEQPDGRFVAGRWSVRLVAGTHRFGQWEFPRVVLTFEGDPEQVAAAVGRLRLWTMRGGA
jgi:hypothetical protein